MIPSFGSLCHDSTPPAKSDDVGRSNGTVTVVPDLVTGSVSDCQSGVQFVNPRSSTRNRTYPSHSPQRHVP